MAQPNQIKEYTGTVIRWIHTYGFISIDENDEYDTGMNVFVHISQIKHQLNESDPVTFKIVVQSDGRLRAIDVSLLDTPGCESEVVWQFCENNDSWIDMNNIVSKKIEFAKENIIIPVQIQKWMYKIVKLDTTTGYQINTTTGTKRNIRKSGESEKISVQLFEEEKENEEFEDEFEGKNEEKCEEEKESKYDTEWNWQDDDETFQPFAKDINSHIATVAVSSISHYKIGKWSYAFYKLSDTVGIQMNEETLKCRLTHCTNWSDDDVGLTDCLAKNIIKFPDIWKNKTNKLQFYPLNMNGRLFADIAKLFYCNEEFDDLDVSTSMVLKIESLQNKFLWKSYVGIRKAHASIIGESNLNERYLWHGTSTDAVQNICSTGFLRDYGETMRYGNGVYFAKNAAFSTEYTKPDSNGLRQMILARVLLGESCQGQESYNVPPLKPNSNVPFESMVDELNGDAEIFVISKDYQVYPEFVVTFKFI
eukprot:209664_1